MNPMNLNIPPSLRVGLYVLTAIGTPLVAYLQSRGVISDLEVGLWSAEVAVVGSLAAINVTGNGPDGRPSEGTGGI